MVTNGWRHEPGIHRFDSTPDRSANHEIRRERTVPRRRSVQGSVLSERSVPPSSRGIGIPPRPDRLPRLISFPWSRRSPLFDPSGSRLCHLRRRQSRFDVGDLQDYGSGQRRSVYSRCARVCRDVEALVICFHVVLAPRRDGIPRFRPIGPRQSLWWPRSLSPIVSDGFGFSQFPGTHLREKRINLRRHERSSSTRCCSR